MEDAEAVKIISDIKELHHLKGLLDTANKGKKTQKARIAEIYANVVPFLKKRGLRYIDAATAGPGTGPFFVLSKHTQEGSWNKERYTEYWTKFLKVLQTNPYELDTPQKCEESMHKFLKEFEKRTLVINEVMQVREKDGVDRLMLWERTGSEYPSAQVAGQQAYPSQLYPTPMQ
jgi:hypothetical protein